MSQDNELQQAILAELNWEPSVTAAHIGVTTKDGVATLTGHVESFAEKYAAADAARRVRGVHAIAEEIEVRLPSDRRRDDADIAAAAVDRLAWDVSIPRDAITVTVENGWLTLNGQVDRHYQREAAEQDVRRLSGVVGVSNQTTIRPAVNVAVLSDDIMHALHRSWLFDPKTISVSAQGGKVRLTGTVHSLAERNEALATAWAAPGTTAVMNELAIA
jgi:osmotically-inducible protein OsmY